MPEVDPFQQMVDLLLQHAEPESVVHIKLAVRNVQHAAMNEQLAQHQRAAAEAAKAAEAEAEVNEESSDDGSEESQ